MLESRQQTPNLSLSSLNDTHISLNRIPGVSDFAVFLVCLDRVNHLRVHPLIDFGSKDISKDTSDQHDDEDEEQNYEEA